MAHIVIPKKYEKHALFKIYCPPDCPKKGWSFLNLQCKTESFVYLRRILPIDTCRSAGVKQEHLKHSVQVYRVDSPCEQLMAKLCNINSLLNILEIHALIIFYKI